MANEMAIGMVIPALRLLRAVLVLFRTCPYYFSPPPSSSRNRRVSTDLTCLPLVPGSPGLALL
jgi:hypothetical protein